MSNNKYKNDTLIVTGYSGAGLSSVLKALEDFGYEVFDNFPLSLIKPLCEQKEGNKLRNIAIGVDARTRGFSPEAVLSAASGHGARLLFISCDGSVLQRRFTETRRRHPLSKDRSVSHGIKSEKDMLAPLKAGADFVIDSSHTSIHDLRHMLEGRLSLKPDKGLTISLLSFGFRNSIPRDADLVMDVRFLKNPHWDPELKPFSGLDKVVGDYICEDPDFEGFISNFKSLISPLLPRYEREGKSYLTIAIGCTGGRHRSVYTVEQLKEWFISQNIDVHTEHRDLT